MCTANLISLKEKMAEYTGKVEKAQAKFPERKNLPYNRLYTKKP